MSTGAKIAIGCAVAVVLAGIVAMVAIGGAAWWLKGKVTEVAGDIGARAEEIESYEKKANANPFTEPADGVVQEARFLKFMETRKAIYAIYEQHRAQFEGLKDKKEADLSDLSKVAGLLGDIRLAQAKALAAAGMSEDEYRFIQTAVYQSAWAAATVKDTGKQPGELVADAMKKMGEATREGLDKAAAQGLPSPSAEELRQAQEAATEMAKATEGLSVPPANLELFHKHEADIKKYAMSGLALIGL